MYQPSVAASVFPDQLAPITRIGGGEVRVDRALLAPAYVRDVTSDEVGTAYGAMSFGFIDADKTYVLTRKLRVVNRSGKAQSYRVKPNFRYQDDADTGAVSLIAVELACHRAAGRIGGHHREAHGQGRRSCVTT